MSSEITATTINISGTARRSIPVLTRYSTVNIAIASGGGVRITSNAVNTAQSIGTTGFAYESPGIYRNTTSTTLVCLISYCVLFNSVQTGVRMTWLQLDNGSERYAMECQSGTTAEPSINGSAIMIVPANSFVTLWTFQQSGFELSTIAQYGTPYLSICII